MPLTKEEITQIATRTADEVMERMREQMEIRDIVIGCAIGEGAIPLYGRETRKEPCAGCRIDPTKPLEAGNVMATTNDAIGTLSRDEVRRWCSEIIEVADGRCARARSIREAARVCKEKYPEDTAKFFECYAPAFSKITKGGNPGKEQGKIATMESLLDTLSDVCRTSTTEVANRLLGKDIRSWDDFKREVLADYPDLPKGG